jgi:hypothetical protein
VEREIGARARHELSRLLGWILVSLIKEHVDYRLKLEFREARSFQVEMAAFDVRFHSRVLQLEGIKVAGVDQDSVSEPDAQKKEPFQTPERLLPFTGSKRRRKYFPVHGDRANSHCSHGLVSRVESEVTTPLSQGQARANSATSG